MSFSEQEQPQGQLENVVDANAAATAGLAGADAPHTATQTVIPDTTPLNQLLRQPVSSAVPAPGQVMLGTLRDVPLGAEAGTAQVPGLGLVTVRHSLVPLHAGHSGQGVALSLVAADSAVVLGLLWNGTSPQAAEPEAPALHAPAAPAQAASSPAAAISSEEGLAVTVEGHREVIEAARELELRCGEACILLTADGRIQLRGTYITSYATATQRIVGGSVHVN